MKITREYDFTDEALGIKTLEGVGIEAEVSLEWDYGSPIVTVDTVEMYGKNLFGGNAISRALAGAIADIIEADDDVLAELMESEGYVYTGRSPSDPRGRMRATS